MSFYNKAQGDISIAIIRAAIVSIADWRLKVVQSKHADDRRNSAAADILYSLAHDEPSAEKVAQLQAGCGLSGFARDTARHVGFSVFPASLDEFIELVIESAAASRAAREAVLPNREGE